MSTAASRTDDAERFGRFVILSPIRKGGMAMLSQAFDVAAGELVLLKRLPPHSGARRDRFLDEIKLSRSMAPHPNLVRTLDADDSAGREFLAIEWIDGPDLDGLIQRAIAGKLDMPVPIPVAASLMWQVLRGLGHLHASGVIHRDVTAANIMVGYDGVAKLIDYGIAKYEGRRHQTQVGDGAVGTLGFAAPEQAEKNEATERSDLYSVGATLWFLLTGLRFFERGVDNNGRDVLKHRLEERNRSNVPPALLTFLWRSLHRSPSVRYDNADEAAHALEKTCELAAPAAVGEFVGSLFVGDRMFAASRLAEWRQKYVEQKVAAPTPTPSAQTTAVIRAVELPPFEREGEGGRSTMEIDWNEQPRSRATVLAWCLVAALVAASSLVVAIKFAARRHHQPPSQKQPPIAVTQQRAPAPVAPLTPPAEPTPAPTSPPVKPAPVALTTAQAGPSALAIRKRLAEARELAAVGRIKVARETFVELEQDPRARPQALLGLARLAQTEGDYTAAIHLSTEAAKAGVGVDAWIVRGGAYLATRDADRATADFDRVLKLQPKNADAAEGLKVAAQLKGQTP